MVDQGFDGSMRISCVSPLDPFTPSLSVTTRVTPFGSTVQPP